MGQGCSDICLFAAHFHLGCGVEAAVLAQWLFWIRIPEFCDKMEKEREEGLVVFPR